MIILYSWVLLMQFSSAALIYRKCNSSCLHIIGKLLSEYFTITTYKVILLFGDCIIYTGYSFQHDVALGERDSSHDSECWESKGISILYVQRSHSAVEVKAWKFRRGWGWKIFGLKGVYIPQKLIWFWLLFNSYG